jgi:hypothetical protein
VIQVLNFEDVLQKYYKDAKKILIIYRWNWRLNRFIRDLSEHLKKDISMNANELLDTNLISIDLKDIDNDYMKDLQKLLKRYDFKYIIK